MSASDKVARVQLGATGPTFSAIAYGIWQWHSGTDEERIAIFDKCIQLGITTFDGADIYGMHRSNQMLGRVLKARPQIKRESIEIVAKCDIVMNSERFPCAFNHYNTSREYIEKSVATALEDIGTTYVDLLLIHRPDFLMNPDEVAATFLDLHKAGKVRAFGVSNFTPGQFNMLASRMPASLPLVTNQIEFSILHSGALTDGTLDLCVERRVRPMFYGSLRPLFASAKESPYLEQTKKTLDEIAQSHKASADQIAIAWVMQHPSGPIPVLGTSKLDRIEAAAKATTLRLSREEYFKLWCHGIGRTSVP